MGKQKRLKHMLMVASLIVLSAEGLVALAAYPNANGTSYAAFSFGRPSTDFVAAVTGHSMDIEITEPTEANVADEAIIVDHSSIDVTAIPQAWIEEAKQELHIAYGHTSHGSQLTTGMTGFIGFANNGGLGLALPWDFFAYNSGGTGGALDLREPLSGDAGYYPQWVDRTTAYLGPPDPATGRGTTNPEINVVIWSWCGQVSGYTEQQMLNNYLLPMTQLEEDYPGITFVYMTGHADGTGEDGNLHLRNQQIRDYCVANDKVLYDFYHIELYDPDEAYFGDKDVDDNCDYDSDGNGSRDKNWAIDWQNAHNEGVNWYTCDCAHSQSLNCNQKAYAAWWLWARLAGWDGGLPAGPQKSASTETAALGETITYTITVRDLSAPLDATVYLTDEVPAGLSYVPGSLSSTAGVVKDEDAPVLHWTGILSPTPVVTVTYAAVVGASEPQVITNRAVIASPGYEPITVTASITIEGPELPDLTPSYKMAYPLRGEFCDPIAYTIVISNATWPFSATVWLTDTVPGELAYLPGTLTSTSGAVSDAAAPILSWSGVLSPSPAVTVTFGATVTTVEAAVIGNDAVIAVPGYETITRTATILINPYRQYLPVVFKND